jgi:predicted RNA methylase
MARNKIEDLRDHLFETIELLKDNEMEIEKAKTIAEVAQVIVNSAKIEVDYIRAIDGICGTGFIPVNDLGNKMIGKHND